MKANIILCIFVAFKLAVASSYLRPCYFTNWAQYRQGRAKFVPEDYVPGLCTHILFAFGWMNEDLTAKAYDPVDLRTEWAGIGMYARVNALKKNDTQLKTLLSFGGWSFGTRLFKEMAKNAANRKIFIDSSIKFVRDHGFDGIDIDWEYPNGEEEKQQFSSFLSEMFSAAHKESELTYRPRLLITAAVAAGTQNILNGYDIPTISRYLDFVLLMSYDFHGSWEQTTGMNAPLFASSQESSQFTEWNVAGAANKWASLGMPKSKIIVGIPTYGRGWTLSEPSIKRGIGAPGSAAQATKFVQLAGTGAYYEFCEMLAAGAQSYFDNETKVPFLIHGDQWFSYEDVNSIRYKTDWIKANRFGGGFVWTLDFDDFNGKCPQPFGSQNYPLIRTIATELSSHQIKIPHPQPVDGRPPIIPPYGSGNVVTSSSNNYGVLKPDSNSVSNGIYIPNSSDEAELNRQCYGQVDGFRTLNSQWITSKKKEIFLLCVSNRGYKLDCPLGMEFDAYRGFCNFKGTSHPFHTQSPHVSTTSTTFVSGSQKEIKPFVCTSDGFFADPASCNRFYRCVGTMAYHFDCPLTLHFSTKSSHCEHPKDANCIYKK